MSRVAAQQRTQDIPEALPGQSHCKVQRQCVTRSSSLGRKLRTPLTQRRTPSVPVCGQHRTQSRNRYQGESEDPLPICNFTSTLSDTKKDSVPQPPPHPPFGPLTSLLRGRSRSLLWSAWSQSHLGGCGWPSGHWGQIPGALSELIWSGKQTGNTGQDPSLPPLSSSDCSPSKLHPVASSRSREVWRTCPQPFKVGRLAEVEAQLQTMQLSDTQEDGNPKFSFPKP